MPNKVSPIMAGLINRGIKHGLIKTIRKIYNQSYFFTRKYNLFAILIKMLSNRAATPGQPRLKYNYKTQTAPSRHYLSPYTAHQKKESRVKAKKDHLRSTHHETTHHSSQNYTFSKEPREPLGQVFDQNVEQCLVLADFHKKQSSALRKRNDDLQQRIKAQNIELEQLKLEMCEIKQNLSKTMDIRTIQSHSLFELNQSLQGQSLRQQEEIASLRQKISALGQFRPTEQHQFRPEMTRPSSNSNDPHEISRRKEYMQHYESVTSDMREEYPEDGLGWEGKDRNEDELRRLRWENAALKQKSLLVEVMEEQIQNKNGCIDFLRNQLEIVETNSNQLLLVIDSLQKKMQAIEGRAHQGDHSWRNKAVSSFHTFSDSHY